MHDLEFRSSFFLLLNCSVCSHSDEKIETRLNNSKNSSICIMLRKGRIYSCIHKMIVKWDSCNFYSIFVWIFTWWWWFIVTQPIQLQSNMTICFSCRFLYLVNMDFRCLVFAWSNPIQIFKKINEQVYSISFKTLFTLHSNSKPKIWGTFFFFIW